MALSFRREMTDGALVVDLPKRMKSLDARHIAEKIRAAADVEFAEPDYHVYAQAIPSDPQYGLQWHYFESVGGINLEPAWDITAGAGSTVAVIDTGNRPHVDLAGQILPGYDFISSITSAGDGDGRDSDASDPGDWVSVGVCPPQVPAHGTSSWHGTHVAGTIAAATNNGIGVAGVAYQAKVVPVRVLGKCGGDNSDLADAIRWAAGVPVNGAPTNANPAHVLNLSLGGNVDPADPVKCPAVISAAIDSARSWGAIVVAAAGNFAVGEVDISANSQFPANCPGVLAVTATSRAGGRASYAKTGSVVGIAAPGGEMNVQTANGVLSTLNFGTQAPGADSYDYYEGTSMATAHVAGVAALVHARAPWLNPDQIQDQIKLKARAFPANASPCTTSTCGAGIVDATAALSNPPPDLRWLPVILSYLVQ